MLNMFCLIKIGAFSRKCEKCRREGVPSKFLHSLENTTDPTTTDK